MSITWWTGWKVQLCCKSFWLLETLPSGIEQLSVRRPCDLLCGGWPNDSNEMLSNIDIDTAQTNNVLVPSVLKCLPCLSLQRTQTCWLGVNSSISEPQSWGNMLHEAHGLSILDLRDSHPLHVSLLGHFDFLLCLCMKAMLVFPAIPDMIHGRDNAAWPRPWKFWSRKRTSWNWPFLRPPAAVLSPHPAGGSGPWWCGECGKTGPI